MDLIEVTRKETGPEGTLGVLTLNKKILCFTLEPPKKNNERDMSCIPTGQYKCVRYESIKFDCPCMAIYDVHGRDYISVHFGNTLQDTNGCLILGRQVGYLKGKRAVLLSKSALKDLVEGVHGPAVLSIREDF